MKRRIVLGCHCDESVGIKPSSLEIGVRYSVLNYCMNACALLKRIVVQVLRSAFDDGDFVFGQFVELINKTINLALPRAHVRLRVVALSGEDAVNKRGKIFTVLAEIVRNRKLR